MAAEPRRKRGGAIDMLNGLELDNGDVVYDGDPVTFHKATARNVSASEQGDYKALVRFNAGENCE